MKESLMEYIKTICNIHNTNNVGDCGCPESIKEKLQEAIAEIEALQYSCPSRMLHYRERYVNGKIHKVLEILRGKQE